MSLDQNNYPAFTDSEWEDFVDIQNAEKREQKYKKKKEKIQKKLDNYSLNENRDLPKGTGDQEKLSLSIVVLGKTGDGKSATANTILGEKRFTEDFTTMSVTLVTEKETKVVNGRKIMIVDTPGLQDTNKKPAEIKREIGKYANYLPNGVHAFIYVMNMSSPRFTQEDRDVLQEIEHLFGGEFEKYCFLVFSNGKPEVNMQDYCEKEIQKGTPFGTFVKDLEWRVVAVDNADKITRYEKSIQQENVFRIIDRMKKENSPEAYTNEAFKKAQEEFRKFHIKSLRKGWAPSVMQIVEEIMDRNYDISRAQLEIEVQKKIAERIQKLEEEKRQAEEVETRRKEEYEEREKAREEERRAQMKRDEEEHRVKMSTQQDIHKREVEERDFRLKKEKEQHEWTMAFGKRESEEKARREQAEHEMRMQSMQVKQAKDRADRDLSEAHTVATNRRGILKRIWNVFW